MVRVDTGGHVGQGNQEGSQWTGRTRGITIDRVDKRGHDGHGGQEG